MESKTFDDTTGYRSVIGFEISKEWIVSTGQQAQQLLVAVEFFDDKSKDIRFLDAFVNGTRVMCYLFTTVCVTLLHNLVCVNCSQWKMAAR
ncbi:unnamed protein product [Colias eurytheme]|nr:unnamed protein product [Colias eurytheme]